MVLGITEIFTYVFVIYIIFYCLNTITKFYGISSDAYLQYFWFYIFLALCVLIKKIIRKEIKKNDIEYI
jgi:hypothetical protein